MSLLKDIEYVKRCGLNNICWVTSLAQQQFIFSKVFTCNIKPNEIFYLPITVLEDGVTSYNIIEISNRQEWANSEDMKYIKNGRVFVGREAVELYLKKYIVNRRVDLIRLDKKINYREELDYKFEVIW